MNLTVPPTELKGHKGFVFQHETEDSVSKLIDSIKLDVATGRDGISSRIIKDSKTVLVPILTKIINLGYTTNTFPNSMKQASIKPLHKKEDSNLISNYRPISILPVISKIFEKDAANQISKFLEENAILNLYQHAYRKGHSTVTCLFELINFVFESVEEKCSKIAVITLDLSKAFDTIHHELLLKKLKNLNLNENSVKYIESYLKNRKQVTKFSNFISKEEEIKSGVPQGSILGPLLFLCFVNDLPEAFTGICKFLSYADDTTLYYSSFYPNNLEQCINEDTEILTNWFNRHGLKVNASKSQYMTVNSPTTDKESTKPSISR